MAPVSDQPLPSNSAISAYGKAGSTIEGTPLSPNELRKIDAYWRASLHLCLGMLYLKANPLLREPLTLEHTKPRLLGPLGSDAGEAFTCTRSTASRVIARAGRGRAKSCSTSRSRAKITRSSSAWMRRTS